MKCQIAVTFFAVCITCCGREGGVYGQARPTERRLIQTMPAAERMRRVPPQPVVRPPSWTSVEQTFNDLRNQRTEWGSNYQSVQDYYETLSSPSSTGSKTLEEHLRHLAQWLEQMPSSSTARVVRAKALLDYAWEARGSGVAATVTKEGWELFAERSKEAHRLLDEAIELGVKDGEAYARLVQIGYAEGHPREQVQAWVDAGMKLDPTYFDIYEEMAVYLMPRWMGEEGDIERFAGEVRRKLPGDNGLEAYAQIAYTIQRYECGWGETLFRGEYDYPTLIQAAEVMLKRYPGSSRVAHFAALCAMVAQDHAAAKRIRPFVGEFNAEDKVWAWQNSWKHFRDWSAAAESPRGEESWAFAGLTGCSGIAFADGPRRVWVAQQFGRSAANLMDVRTGEVAFALPHPGGVLNGFEFDASRGWALISAWNGPLTGWMLWDLSGMMPPVSHATEEMCRAIAIHPMKPVVFWAEGKTVHSWDVAADAAGPDIQINDHVHWLQISADGSLLAVNNVICETATGSVKHKLPADPQQPSKIHVSKIVAIDAERHALATVTSSVPKEPKNSFVRFSEDGKTWETLLDGIGSSSAWLSPDGKLLATARPIANATGVSRIEIWNLATRKRVKEFDGHWNSINDLSFSPDGSKLASVGSWADAVKIWPLDGLAE